MKDEKYNLSGSLKGKFNSLIKEVLVNVRPSKDEIADAKFAINEIMGRLMKETPKDVEILLAGSVARGTQIRGNSDIDIFLLFPRNLKKEAIEKKGLEIGKKIVNKKNKESYVVKYAEHPYTRLFLNNLKINVDIVPAYKIENAKERGTAVDRTQLHNEFINSHLTEKQRDDVRVLKAFLKAHRIYGAEARTECFSGYLCELLTYNYGSLLDVITNISNTKLPLIINPLKSKTIDPDSQSILKLFGKNFIVVDPTDNNRNVAANVSEESFFRFVLISRQLLASPDMKTFYGGSQSDIYSEKKLLGLRSALGVNLYVLHFEVPDIADDIIWQQLKKTRLRLQDILSANGFAPMISLQNTATKEAVIGFFISDHYLAATKVIGPNLQMGEAVEQFLKAHKNSLATSIENGRVYSIEKARYSNAEDLIREFLKSKSTMLPSNLNSKKSALYVNKIPEKHAKLAYNAYLAMFSI
jgi:tRNA nucleotidyltransferase (CCA-adding enzyme)